MRHSTFLLRVAALFLAGGAAAAQTKPNFSGKWIILPDSSPTAQPRSISRGGGEMGGLGDTAVIVQDDKLITIARNTPNMGEITSVFNLDGTEKAGSVNVNGSPIPLTMKSRWDGNRLVTSTWANVGQMIEIVLTLWVDDKGNLVTEHTFPTMGPDMPGGTFTARYKKT